MDRWMLKSKGVIVEAVQLKPDNVDEVLAWTGGTLVEEEDKISNRMYDGINVPTPAGTKRLSLGMYAVKWNGIFYLAQRGVFESQYMRATPKQRQPSDPSDAYKLPKFQKEPWFDAPKPGDPNYEEPG